MGDDVFDAQVLADKLSKLNSSQQSIESLSKLCISQRKKAKQIVEIWHKLFNKAQREQQVSFLYLANDILQNSRRKGNEFTNEFWKVMPSALKNVNENGDENGRKAASRLVGIWDERRVFGSRTQNLKDEMLGKTQLPSTNAKTPNPIKIVKRDANALRLKVTVGGTPEKIMSAFHLVHDENSTEDTALSNCEAAVRRVGDLERDIETQGIVAGSSLVDEIQAQENVLKECVNQLETAEKTRASLISQLKVALQDQEARLDVIHSQLKVARHQIDHAANLKKKLVSPGTGELSTNVDTQSSMMFASGEEENKKKAAAAAMAAKLAASASSAQMLSSVLSSLVAEEAASISSGFNSATSVFPPEKRQKIETPSEYVFHPPLPPNQFVQTSGVGIQPYGYGGGSLPPPPPPVPMMPPHQQQQQSQPQQQQQQQPQPQQNTASGYYRPPGIGFYGQSHQPVPR